MTNEEYVEEILYTAHQHGVYNDILNEVDIQMKTNFPKTFQEVLSEVFYKLVKEGKIPY